MFYWPLPDQALGAALGALRGSNSDHLQQLEGTGGQNMVALLPVMTVEGRSGSLPKGAFSRRGTKVVEGAVVGRTRFDYQWQT